MNFSAHMVWMRKLQTPSLVEADAGVLRRSCNLKGPRLHWAKDGIAMCTPQNVIRLVNPQHLWLWITIRLSNPISCRRCLPDGPSTLYAVRSVLLSPLWMKEQVGYKAFSLPCSSFFSSPGSLAQTPGHKSLYITMKSVVASAALFAASASAISVYGQCGGKGWTGSGTCDSGSYCFHQNDYYWQCVPGSASTTLVTTTKPASTTTTTKAPSSAPPSSTKAPTTAPPSTTKAPTTTSGGASPTSTGTPVSVSGNPFSGKQIYANPYYASEINSIAIPSLPASLAPAASAVANVGTFVWL